MCIQFDLQNLFIHPRPDIFAKTRDILKQMDVAWVGMCFYTIVPIVLDDASNYF